MSWIETFHTTLVARPGRGTLIYDFVAGDRSFGWRRHEMDGDGRYNGIAVAGLDDLCASLAAFGSTTVARELGRVAISLEFGQQCLLDRAERTLPRDGKPAHILRLRAMHLRRARLDVLERLVEAHRDLARAGTPR